MQSKIAEALKMKLEPVAILWSDTPPEHARQFRPGKWGCVMWMLGAAARGATAAFTRETYGCWGGGVGLGFGNCYPSFPGGLECFYRFLSSGNAGWEPGERVAKAMEAKASERFLKNFLEGEGYLADPEVVRQFVQGLPIMEVPTRYVVFKPLKEVDPAREEPKVVVFLPEPNQLSALVILANYRRWAPDNVIIPYAAGCQTIGIFPYQEAARDRPRAVVGLTDISARNNLRKLGRNLLSFAVPWKLLLEMEGNVQGSFLERREWKELVGAGGRD